MTTHEFVTVYVALPLAIAIGWLLWRARYFLRNMLFYALAVAAILLLVRAGHLAWSAWESMTYSIQPAPSYPFCIAPGGRPGSGTGGQCWT